MDSFVLNVLQDVLVVSALTSVSFVFQVDSAIMAFVMIIALLVQLLATHQLVLIVTPHVLHAPNTQVNVLLANHAVVTCLTSNVSKAAQ